MKKVYLLLFVFLALIFCSYAVASSNDSQEDAIFNESDVSDFVDFDIENSIIVEYDENDDSVMTLSGGYPMIKNYDSQSSNQNVVSNNQVDSSYDDYSELSVGVEGSCAHCA